MGSDVFFWLTGPVDFGGFSSTALATTVGVGLVAFGASVYLSRRITAHALVPMGAGSSTPKNQT
jgi:hypothetical protein